MNKVYRTPLCSTELQHVCSVLVHNLKHLRLGTSTGAKLYDRAIVKNFSILYIIMLAVPSLKIDFVVRYDCFIPSVIYQSLPLLLSYMERTRAISPFSLEHFSLIMSPYNFKRNNFIREKSYWSLTIDNHVRFVILQVSLNLNLTVHDGMIHTCILCN